MVNDLVWLALIRYLGSHRWQTLLSVLGIMLGVAVVVAVDLANQSVRRSFELSMEQITGGSTHRIIGGPIGLEENFYTELRVNQGLETIAPVVEGSVRIEEQTFTLLGLDPLAEAPFRSFTVLAQKADKTAKIAELLTQPGSVLMAAISASQLDVSTGDTLSIQSAGIDKKIVIAGLIGSDRDNELEGLLIADIATGQELLDKIGRLDRIDLKLNRADLPRVTALLPVGTRLVAAKIRNRALADLSHSFQINLSAMSLLALLVGGFLIYNAISFSVLQRRALLGMLRMVGVTRVQLFVRILLEAFIVGLVGTLAGLLSGILLGRGLVKLVAQTVNDLYFTTNVSTLLIAPEMLLKGLLLGILVTLLAAFLPALEAARSEPRSVTRRSASEYRTFRALPWLIAAGISAIALGILMIRIPGKSLMPGFSGLFFIIAGYCLVVPALVFAFSRLLTPVLAQLSGFTGLFAIRSISASLSRTGLAIAALTMAVAATVGMGIMVESFRGTVANWMARSLQGELYLSIPHSTSRLVSTPLPDGLVSQLNKMEGIAALSTGRRVEVETAQGSAELLAIEMAPASYKGFLFKGTLLPDMWREFHRGNMVLISEPYAFHQGLLPGDTINLLTASGERQFIAGGIFYDYGSDRGVIVMDRLVYADLWNDSSISTVGVYFNKPTPVNSNLTRIRALAFNHDPRIRVRSNGEILQSTMKVFDRTFTITRVLRLLVIMVAFVGILSALMALQFERLKENAVLRASGFTRFELVRLTILQTGLMGLFAGLLSLPLGWLISRILMDVINHRSFGWTLHSQIDLTIYFEAVLLALGAALLAGVYPGIKMSRTSAAEALREE